MGIPSPVGLDKWRAKIQKLISVITHVTVQGRRQKAEVPADIKGKGVDQPSEFYMSVANQPATRPQVPAPAPAPSEPPITLVPDVAKPDAVELGAEKPPTGAAGSLATPEAADSRSAQIVNNQDEDMSNQGRAENSAPHVEESVGKGKDSGVSMGENATLDQPLAPAQLEKLGSVGQPGEGNRPQGSAQVHHSALVSSSMPMTVLQSSTTTGDIAVMVPLSKLERVRTLRFRNSDTVNAREVVPSERDKEKLRQFSSFVGTPNQLTLFGRRLPECHRYLVEIDESAGGVRTYVCIEGLSNDDDIRDFHAVMCQRSCRKYYDPWHLCFRKCSVTRTASEDNTISAEKQEHAPTLCGSLLTTTRGKESWTSTIGGLIEVDGRLCALTTSHSPREASCVSSTSTYASAASRFSEADYPDDVGSVLVLVDDEKSTASTQATRNNKPAKGTAGKSESWTLGDIHQTLEGDDWRLVHIPKSSTYLNYLGHFHLDKLATHELDLSNSPSSAAREPRLRYLMDYVEKPSAHPVTIKTGVTGYHSGKISLGSSFLDGKDGPMEVWTVHLAGSGIPTIPPLFFRHSLAILFSLLDVTG